MSAVCRLKIEGISHGAGIRLFRRLPLMEILLSFSSFRIARSRLKRQHAVSGSIDIQRTYQLKNHVAYRVSCKAAADFPFSTSQPKIPVSEAA